MTRYLFAALAATIGVFLEARAQDDGTLLTPAQLEQRAAQFVVFVPPEYPKAAAEQGRGAVVDVIGEVREDGTFDLQKATSDSDDPAFAQAVRETTRFWTLRPSYGADCAPRRAPTQVRIWFEHKAGEPVISFGQAKAETTEGKALKIVHRRAPAYPPQMLMRGLSGSLEILMRVAPNGRVEELELVPGPITRMATREVATALRQWRFEPRPEGDGPACVSFLLTYQVTDGFTPGPRTRSGAREDGAH